MVACVGWAMSLMQDASSSLHMRYYLSIQSGPLAHLLLLSRVVDQAD